MYEARSCPFHCITHAHVLNITLIHAGPVGVWTPVQKYWPLLCIFLWLKTVLYHFYCASPLSYRDFFMHASVQFREYSTALCIRFCLSITLDRYDSFWPSSYTNREIITVKQGAYLWRVSSPPSVSDWERGKEDRDWKVGVTRPPNIHLSLMKMKIVRGTQRSHLTHPSVFCFSGLVVSQTWIASHFSSLQLNRILDFRGCVLMISDIERGLLSDPCDPEP